MAGCGNEKPQMLNDTTPHRLHKLKAMRSTGIAAKNNNPSAWADYTMKSVNITVGQSPPSQGYCNTQYI